jgi:hypothetical protein
VGVEARGLRVPSEFCSDFRLDGSRRRFDIDLAAARAVAGGTAPRRRCD